MKFANLVIQLREIKKKYNIDHCVRYRYDECKYRIDYFTDLKFTIQWFRNNKNYNGSNTLSGLLKFIEDNE